MKSEHKKKEFYLISGVIGCGKTTVIDMIEKQTGIKVINYGTETTRIGISHGIIKNRDEIRLLPIETFRELQLKAAKNIAMHSGKVIIDSHISFLTPHGYFAGFPKYVLDILPLKHIILIEANKEEIQKRRDKDPTRIRSYAFEQKIDEHQEINRTIAANYAFYCTAMLSTVHNNEGELEQCVEEITKLVTVD